MNVELQITDPTINAILEQISELYKVLEILRKNCSHSKKKIEYSSNTGNYDPTQDCYFEHHICLICGNREFKEFKAR